MVDSKINFVLFINLMSIFQVSLLETVHFTNSPNKILRANNFTTYKVEVPNGDPITIIEGNTPLINKKIRFNDVENSKYSINQNQENGNKMINLKTSLSMTVTPHLNVDEHEKMPTGEEESVTIDDGNLSPEHTQQSMKTVYSPELLEKFLRDYANKVHVTEPTSIQSQDTTIEVTDDEPKDKYESIEAEDDGNRRVSNVNADQEPQSSDTQERKRYRPGSESNNYHHPYNKNNGWVTLEAVPWSKSKVSKWQSSVKPTSSNYNYPSGASGGYNRPSRPPYNYEEDYGNNNDNDEFYNQKPSRPTFQNNQFYSPSSSGNNRPTPPPESSYSHHTQSSHYDDDYRPNRPHYQSERPSYHNERPSYQSERPSGYKPDIITDNRPSNFPSHEPSYEHNRPNSYDRPNHYDRPHSDHYHSGGSHYSNKDGTHPITYPNGGSSGEWILVSTTKGYQFPKRHGQRAMMFQAQNGIGDTRKNDNKGIITAASQMYENSVRPPFPSQQNRPQVGPTKTTQQQVKLTVLPLFVKNENRPNGYGNNNKVEMSVYKPSNYNGIIETEPSKQTIEESVAAAANANEANSIAASAQTLPKKKRKRTKNYALVRKNPNDSTAVLAAVSSLKSPLNRLLNFNFFKGWSGTFTSIDRSSCSNGTRLINKSISSKVKALKLQDLKVPKLTVLPQDK